MNRLCTGAAAFCAVLLLCLAVTQSQAYNVRYSTMTTDSGMRDFESPGYCATKDPSSHTMMPKLESFQTLAYDAYQKAGFSMAPIGGNAEQAACLNELCRWIFNHGLLVGDGLPFFYGVIYKGTPKVKAANGVYNNFKSGEQPLAWENVSYWGARHVYMKNDGTWANINIVTLFKQWVCEYYEFTSEDAVNMPTYINGDIITDRELDTHYHCGKLIEIDEKGRWIDVLCKKRFPWWAGLIIALIVLFVIVTVIITLACCFCVTKRSEERKLRERALQTTEDNPMRIPTQTQLGKSRSSVTMEASDVWDD